jgi:hypothetical protein
MNPKDKTKASSGSVGDDFQNQSQPVNLGADKENLDRSDTLGTTDGNPSELTSDARSKETNAFDPTQLLDELQNLKFQLGQFKQRNQDLARFLAGADQTSLGGGFNNKAQDTSKTFLADPHGFTQQMIQQALTEFRQNQQAQLAVHTAKIKNPEMVPFEAAIMAEATQLAKQAETLGKPLSVDEAIEQGIQAFRHKLNVFLNQSQKQQQAEQIRSQALRFDVGMVGQPVNRSLVEQIQDTGKNPKTWAENRDKIKQQLRFTQSNQQ